MVNDRTDLGMLLFGSMAVLCGILHNIAISNTH